MPPVQAGSSSDHCPVADVNSVTGLRMMVTGVMDDMITDRQREFLGHYGSVSFDVLSIKVLLYKLSSIQISESRQYKA